MGEETFFQPLTKEDKISVILYRSGIVLSSFITAIIAFMFYHAETYRTLGDLSLRVNAVLVALYISVGMSVFFIHLYVSKFHRALKQLYYVSVVALMVLFILGKGDPSAVLFHRSFGPLLLLPLSGCLGFVTAKEAFCFRLAEGYLLTLIMPAYLVLLSAGVMTLRGILCGSALIAALLLFFTVRKVFMPLHYDIGDKSAYS
ncbi:MAG TPA: DUF2301 domain-containing membrane protein [Thermodesulfovibrionales bacterium]|nr:DUF2301 domain-containing membrane protein [Thermodesulfovibrionales bacterium]